jgi:putative membrane protein
MAGLLQNNLLTLCLATLPAAGPDAIWRAWSLAPATVLPMLLAIALFARGTWVSRGTDPAAHHRAWLLAAGIAILAVALISPLCRLASTLAWAHMIQHVLLVAVAPLLLTLSRPGKVLLAGLPAAVRDRLAFMPQGQPSQSHAFLLVAFLLYGVNIWFWHIPALYEGALLNTGLHLLMVTSLLAVSLMFWHAVLETYRATGASAGLSAMLLFFTFMHTGALGIFLTVSSQVWYPVVGMRSAVWGMLPLDDQRLAGLIMWVPMGGIYVVAALALFARLIAGSGGTMVGSVPGDHSAQSI